MYVVVGSYKYLEEHMYWWVVCVVWMKGLEYLEVMNVAAEVEMVVKVEEGLQMEEGVKEVVVEILHKEVVVD